MNKKILSLMAILVLSIQFSSGAWANNNSVSVRSAIKKYKTGNYTGCLQYCQNLVRRDPSNAVAYYYMAMAYAQAGRKDEAITAYSKVLALKPNAKLSSYASTGRRCLETPDKCHLEPAKSSTPELDRFIAKPSSDFLSPAVKQDIENKRLEGIKQKINGDKNLDDYDFRNFKDYTGKRSQVEVKDETVAQHKPTDAEIVAAIKVLNNAGLNAYAQQAQALLQTQAVTQPDANQVSLPLDPTAAVNPYAQNTSYQNPEAAQLSMLMGNNNSKNNSSMMNMLPYMLAQSKNGSSTYSPQMIQSVIMNSMMTDFNFDSGNKNDN